MIDHALISTIRSLRPCLPAKDFALSQRFYATLGFEATILDPTLIAMNLGPHSFLLQDFYVKDWAENFVMHLFVDDVAPWWAHIQPLELEKHYPVRAPIPPRLEPWGLWATYVIDPAGVLWQIQSRP